MNPEMYATLQFIDSPQRNFARSALPDAPVVPEKHRKLSGALQRLRAVMSTGPHRQRYLMVGRGEQPGWLLLKPGAPYSNQHEHPRGRRSSLPRGLS
jgi:hypothetical protein